MKNIGTSAFEKCVRLESITIPASVETIEPFTFQGCLSLTSFTIPNSVTGIGFSAFMDCSRLESVVIGSGVKSIGYDAFSGCSNLDAVYYKGSILSFLDVSIGANKNLTDADIYFYSEKKEEGCWHYVNDVPTVWKK